MHDRSLREADPVPSPCVSVCRMEDMQGGTAGQLCSGCLRTLDEIVAWGQASNDFKREVWAKIAVRRAALSE